MDAIVKKLDDIFVKKAPFQLPENAKEWIVKYGPWIDLVLLVFVAAPVVLLGIGISFLAMPFLPAQVATGIGLVWFFALAYLGLLVFALPGLFARKMAGWNLLFLATLVNFVGDLFNPRGIIGSVIGLVVGLYFLMQIRSKYH